MASVNEINIGENSNMHYYDPKENKKVSLIPKQLYPMHCIKVSTRVVDVKNKYKAKVYNLTYEIAKECDKMTYTTDQGEVNGSPFVGKVVYGNGIFMFLNPGEGDTFEPNNGANEKYVHFCQSIKVNCPEVERVINGESRMVRQMPELKDEDIIGSPIMGFVDIQEYVKDGEKKKAFKVKDFSEWDNGKKRDLETDNLPF